MERRVWEELETYYSKHGIGYICCCATDQYSHRIYHHDEVHLLDSNTRFIIEHAFEHLKRNGYHADIYETDVICSSIYVPPMCKANQVICVYNCDLRHINILNVFSDREDTHSDDNNRRVMVYFWTN